MRSGRRSSVLPDSSLAEDDMQPMMENGGEDEEETFSEILTASAAADNEISGRG